MDIKRSCLVALMAFFCLTPFYLFGAPKTINPTLLKQPKIKNFTSASRLKSFVNLPVIPLNEMPPSQPNGIKNFEEPNKNSGETSGSVTSALTSDSQTMSYTVQVQDKNQNNVEYAQVFELPPLPFTTSLPFLPQLFEGLTDSNGKISIESPLLNNRIILVNAEHIDLYQYVLKAPIINNGDTVNIELERVMPESFLLAAKFYTSSYPELSCSPAINNKNTKIEKNPVEDIGSDVCIGISEVFWDGTKYNYADPQKPSYLATYCTNKITPSHAKAVLHGLTTKLTTYDIYSAVVDSKIISHNIGENAYAIHILSTIPIKLSSPGRLSSSDSLAFTNLGTYTTIGETFAALNYINKPVKLKDGTETLDSVLVIASNNLNPIHIDITAFPNISLEDVKKEPEKYSKMGVCNFGKATSLAEYADPNYFFKNSYFTQPK